MRRPRRPILAAVCAALLLATVVIWVRGMWVRDSWDWITEGGVETSWGFGAGQIWASRHDAGNNSPGAGFRYDNVPAEGTDARMEHPLWFHVEHFPPDWWAGSIPLWFVTLLPAAGLWWWGHRRKVGKGFPVESVAVGER